MIAVISRFESYDIFRDRAKVKRPVRYLFRRDESDSMIVIPVTDCLRLSSMINPDLQIQSQIILKTLCYSSWRFNGVMDKAI